MAGGIPLSAKFDVAIAEPIDSKTESVSTFTDLANTPFPYKGMQRLVEDEDVIYFLKTDFTTWTKSSGGITDAANGLNNNNGVAELGTNPLNKPTEITDNDDNGFGVTSNFDDSEFPEFRVKYSQNSTLYRVEAEELNESTGECIRKSSVILQQTRSMISHYEADALNSRLRVEINKAFSRVYDSSGVVFNGVTVDENGVVIEATVGGKGLFFNNATNDEANVGAWGTTPNQSSSDQRIIANLPSKTEVDAKENKNYGQVLVSSTTLTITSALHASKTLSVFGVGALCEMTLTSTSLDEGGTFEVVVGDSDGFNWIPFDSDVVLFGVNTGSTTEGDIMSIRRVPNGSYNNGTKVVYVIAG